MALAHCCLVDRDSSADSPQWAWAPAAAAVVVVVVKMMVVVENDRPEEAIHCSILAAIVEERQSGFANIPCLSHLSL